MNKEEVRRIMKLVQEGKLSPEDAAELMEAFDGTSDGAAESTEQTTNTTPPPLPNDAKDPFAGIIESIEKIGKEVAKSVNWQDVASQVKTGVTKGQEAIKHAVEGVKQGRISFDIFGATERKDVELEFEVAEGGLVKVENRVGDVRVIGGAEKTKLIARAKVRGGVAEEAKKRAEEYSPVIEQNDGSVTIRHPDSSDITADLEIHLAVKAHVDVRGQVGSIDVDGTHGPCRVASNSGDVKISGVEGAVEVTTSHGDVFLKDVTGTTVVVEDKSGSVKLENVTGALNLRTASGDLSLVNCSGSSISLEAVSGDISMDLSTPISGTVTVRSVQGNASIGIADGSDVRVTLSTLRGTVDCVLDMQDVQRDQRRITGTLGEGTGTLDVSAITGDITVRQRIHSA
ncbi:MAG: DUF4097 family beta strand repeat protein [Chthonomonas sp.]|nr:DUF4097 family beta strand repeat protein [Chthonomonas sp.]